ncbi:hypothetical protein [Sinorhizobium sp. BG8]|uniref:hypothetical protein n=1 Tax=Sinorhizobium sp. BG8 TaxID=2613773 RepID=UPI00193DDF7E|nr:hypothetical protein [Sinorhizobium sp. BG8]
MAITGLPLVLDASRLPIALHSPSMGVCLIVKSVPVEPMLHDRRNFSRVANTALIETDELFRHFVSERRSVIDSLLQARVVEDPLQLRELFW